jgi:hypothetical protein
MAGFDVEGARAAGYTDAEIVAHLTKTRPFDTAGARKAGYSDGEIISHLIKAPPQKTGAALIPGSDGRPVGAPPPPPAEPSIVDRAIGAGEAGLATLTGATTGLAGGVMNFIGVLGEEAARKQSGQYLDDAAIKRINEAFGVGQRAYTYQPRTDAGQDALGVVADVGAGLTPLAGLAGELGVIAQAGRAARTGAPAATTARAAVEGTARDIAGAPGAAAAATAIDATGNAARAVQRTSTTLPKRAWAAISREDAPSTPTPGTLGSAGAAATDAARQRVATAESLGLTGDAALTTGQATRDAGQLKFEVETAKNPEQGAALRQRRIAQNEVLLQNFENAIDQTGAQAPSLRAVGQVVDEALVRQFEADKAAVRRAYEQAHRSPEAQRVVDQGKPVTIGEGERQITGTPLTWINSQPTGVPAVQLIDAARQYAVKLGIAEMRDGDLVPRPATIRQMEEWRTAIGEATGYDTPEIRQSTILKGLIDAQTEPLAGPLYRQARGTRRRLAENYEDRAAVAKLLNDKRGTGDRQVALEDVFQHSIVKGSLDDVRNVRRVLHRSGEPGQQAWRELQGATLQWMKGKAGLDNFGVSQRVTTDSAGRAVLSPEGLNAAIRELDGDGRLQFIFGNRGAQRLRDINEIAQVAKTVPPEAGINFSNTASTMLAAFGDVAGFALTGVPAPLATATRLGLKHVKDAKTRKRVAEALRGVSTTTSSTTP